VDLVTDYSCQIHGGVFSSVAAVVRQIQMIGMMQPIEVTRGLHSVCPIVYILLDPVSSENALFRT
jgi:hypothetical protein